MSEEKMMKIVSEDGQYWSFLTKESLMRQLKPNLISIKAGDKIWIEVEFNPNVNDDIKAHFPSEPKKVELPDKFHACVYISNQELASKLEELIDYLAMKEKQA